MKISIISLISYDAEYLLQSIPRYYNYVDEIILGIDEDRVTWNRQPFSIDEGILQQLDELDTEDKISLIEDNFHKFDDPQLNDNYERNELKKYCEGDVILSFDADEILLNAKEFFLEYLPIAYPYLQNNDICMHWVTPYKVIDDTVLLISEENNKPFFKENQGISAGADSEYVYSRWTDKSANGENRLHSPLVALHWSLARKYNDLSFKLQNTGHAKQLQNNPLLSIWQNVDLNNYDSLRNFKTTELGRLQWPKLTAIPLDKLEQHIKQYINEVY